MNLIQDVLLVAIGFTGTFTLAWLSRLVWSKYQPPRGVIAHFSSAGNSIDVLVREIAAARREVLLLAGQLACRPLAQALVEARLRGATVDVVLDPASESDPASDLHFLVDQGLALHVASRSGLSQQTVLIDGKTALVASFPMRLEGEAAGILLVLPGHTDLVHACRQEFESFRASARTLQGKPSAAISQAPSHPPSTDVLDAVARGLTGVAADDEQEEDPPAAPGGAVVTPAAAEMFARLREQLSEEGDKKKAG